MSNLPSWVHIIGICGSATSAIAIMLKDAGVKVTGSDKGFFPPVSEYLEKNDIQVGVGYKPERLTKEGNHPDFVVMQGQKPDNPEIEEAQNLGIPIKNFTEVLQDFVVVGESIVVAGTYGKTTITSALVEIYNNSELEISYMFGGVPVVEMSNAKVKNAETKYSIVEGDEYKTSLSDTESKFFKYSPKYMILHSCKWEHPDLFKTEAEYSDNFGKIVSELPEDGLLVANANDENVTKISKSAKCKVVFYSIDRGSSKIAPEWFLDRTTIPLPTFIKWNKENGEIEVIPYTHNLIGEFNEENLLAASVLASELGVKIERIQEGLENYKGIKRRLENVYEDDNFLLIDDFGSSPPKARGSLESVRVDYPEAEIIAVFEPNTGNRTEESIETYKSCFDMADKVIFPRFTRLPQSQTKHLNEAELMEKLKVYYDKIEVKSNDEELVESLLMKNEQKKIIIFLGSHGFRGMIRNLEDLLKNG